MNRVWAIKAETRLTQQEKRTESLVAALEELTRRLRVLEEDAMRVEPLKRGPGRPRKVEAEQ